MNKVSASTKHMNGKSVASDIRRTKHAVKRLRPTSTSIMSTRSATLLGAAVTLTGLAAGASILFRRPIARLVQMGIEEALLAGHTIGETTTQAGARVGKELDLAKLLGHVGLERRRSVFSRILPELGMLAAAVGAAGATAFLLRSGYAHENDRVTTDRSMGANRDADSLNQTTLGDHDSFASETSFQDRE